MGRDPLLPSSWYDLTPDIIACDEVWRERGEFLFLLLNLFYLFNLLLKGGASILSHFGGSVARTIACSLPHLNLDAKLFTGLLSPFQSHPLPLFCSLTSL